MLNTIAELLDYSLLQVRVFILKIMLSVESIDSAVSEQLSFVLIFFMNGIN